MTAAGDRTAVQALPLPARWHRPLIALAVAMAALSVLTAVLAVVDPREILGQNAWFKPLKFALSIAIYAVTLAWMIGVLPRFRRLAAALGTVAVVGLVIEIAIITGAVALDTTSHFNVATPLNTTLWVIMAASIVVVWLVTLFVGVALVMSPMSDAARNLAVRAGVVLGVIGMGLAFLMTGPRPDQIQDFQGIAGAHAVGVADGGAGIPFFGWSTEGGDLRVPHFLGIHALQAIPLVLLVIELLARRFAVLGDVRVRFRLVLIVAVAYAAVLGLATIQALAGESVVAPGPPVLVAGAAIVVGALVAAGGVLAAGMHARRRAGVLAP